MDWGNALECWSWEWIDWVRGCSRLRREGDRWSNRLGRNGRVGGLKYSGERIFRLGKFLFWLEITTIEWLEITCWRRGRCARLREDDYGSGGGI